MSNGVRVLPILLVVVLLIVVIGPLLFMGGMMSAMGGMMGGGQCCSSMPWLAGVLGLVTVLAAVALITVGLRRPA